MSRKFNRKKLRKLIQQEINSLGEDILVTVGKDRQGTPPLAPQDDCGQCGLPADICTCPTSSHDTACTCSECGSMLNECGCDGGSQEMGTSIPRSMQVVGGMLGDSHPHGGGAYMSKSQLHKTASYAKKLYDMIPENYDLQDWMRTKISQIADDIGEVYHALNHDSSEGEFLDEIYSTAF